MYYIYRIRNKNPHKSYIGMTKNYKKRFLEHKRELRKGTHPCKDMQSDYILVKRKENMYMEYEILAEYPEKEIAQNLEYLFICKELAHRRQIYNKVQSYFPLSLLEKNNEYVNKFIDNRTILHAYFTKEIGDNSLCKLCKILDKEYLLEILEK